MITSQTGVNNDNPGVGWGGGDTTDVCAQPTTLITLITHDHLHVHLTHIHSAGDAC